MHFTVRMFRNCTKVLNDGNSKGARYRVLIGKVLIRESASVKNKLVLAVLRSCPEVAAPNGSYVSNGTLTSRTFLCKSGNVFPDSGERKRTLECRNGKWNETIAKLPTCVGKNSLDEYIIYCMSLNLSIRLSKDKT